MSFAYYIFDSGTATSEFFWSTESVADQIGLCARETALRVFLDHLPKHRAILDAGCGLARWVIYLRRRNFRAFGVDRVHAALAQARRFEALMPLFAGDTLSLPLRDQSLGAVISLGVVEHLRDGPVAALRELRRILVPGGVALVAVPYNNFFRRCLVNHLRRLGDWRKRRAGLKLNFAEYRFSGRELRGFLEEAGFAVISLHADDFNPPFGKGLWVDSPSFFGYRVGMFDLAPGRKRWELNRRGRIAQRLANGISPWLIAGGVLAVARRT